MSSGTVSVVIPTFNRAYCLEATLGSLQRQSYTDWEAVVVDDGSTDDTPSLLARLREQDSRIKYHRQPNGGVSAARNTGLRVASGRWIGFLDSDDSWEPWKLAAQLACFERLPDVGMVWTDMNAFNEAGELVSTRHLRKMYRAYSWFGNRPIFEHEQGFAGVAPELARQEPLLAQGSIKWGDLFSAMIVGSLVHTSTVLLTRERLNAVGFFNETFRSGEDYEFHLRTCREGPVALLDAPAVRYRIAGGSDQLTARRYYAEIARNALSAREAAIARDASRITLSQGQISRILAEANTWVAEELFESGSFAAARPYYRRGLSHYWRDPRRLTKAVLTLPPAAVTRALLELYRRRA